MTSAAIAALLSSFVASAVEFVEALTVVLAVGVTRQWRSTLVGVGAAIAVLTALVVVLGPLLMLVPIDVLRLVVGEVLMVFGLQWLTKAILRAGGARATPNELTSFSRQVAALADEPAVPADAMAGSASPTFMKRLSGRTFTTPTRSKPMAGIATRGCHCLRVLCSSRTDTRDAPS